MNAARERRERGQGGFTITELLVAIVIFAIISTAMYNLLFSQNRFFDSQEAGNATAQNTRIALKRLSNDVLLVGRGINALSLDNPDVILPNDGTVPVNTVGKDAITLLSIPNGVRRVPFAANASRAATSITVVDDSAGVARGLTMSALVIVHDSNLTSSQVLSVASVKDNGATVSLGFVAADSLLAGYPMAYSGLYPLNTISYRVNATNPEKPHLERRVDSKAWEKIVPGIESLAFTYYDQANTPIVPADQGLRRQIRKVKIDMGGRSVRALDSKGSYLKLPMSTEITPRNMME
ncbi:MAG: type II secretion system protein [Gemmatimonadetes bacterium]|nr:type II secretion system protein [Gemmatimonadota bacterium]